MRWTLVALACSACSPAPPLRLQRIDREAQLGHVAVPERRASRSSATIEVAFVRLPSTSPRPGRPIIVLPGSPGGSAGTDALRLPGLRPFFERLRARADVIVLDYRGSGMSMPRLDCPESEPFPPDVFATRESALAFFVAQARRCAAAIGRAGRDIAGYTWAEVAADVDDLRRAIGASQVDLVGFSSGTHVALALLRRSPASIGRVVFLGTEGLDDTRKLPAVADRQLRAIGDLVRADPHARAHGDFPALVARVLARLDRQPLTVRIERPDSGEPVDAVVGRFGLEFLTARSLAGPEEFTMLPALYASLDRGDLEPITRVMGRIARRPPPSPLAHVFDAASGSSAARAAAIRAQEPASLLGRGLGFPHPEIAAAWGVRDLGEAFRAPVTATTPALFITGALDGNTPVDQAERVRRGFPDSVHLTITNGGHASTMTLPAAADAIAAFLGGADVSARRLVAPAVRFPAGR